MESQNAAQKSSLVDKSRRSFLGVMLGLVSAFIGALLAIPVLRYLFYPLTAKANSSDWSAAGSSSEAAASLAPLSRKLEMKQKDGWRETDSTPMVYLIKKGNEIQALSAICPHLGCTVPWIAERKEFVCPCHVAVFGPDGSYRSGPARRGMDILETKTTNGQVMVKYQTFRTDVPNKEVTS